MDIGKRIREKRKAAGLTQTQVADYFGIRAPSVSEWENKGGPSKDKLAPLARLLKTTVSYLLTGKESNDVVSINYDVLMEGLSKPFDQNVLPSMIGTRAIPIISAVQAGELKDMEVPYSPGDGFAVEFTTQKLSRWAFGLEVEGDSMLPVFQPGDRIIVDPEISPNPGDYVVARNGSNQATFKKYRLRGMDPSGEMIFELVPLNPDYPTLRSDIDHLIVIGVVTEHRKQLRKIGRASCRERV